MTVDIKHAARALGVPGWLGIVGLVLAAAVLLLGQRFDGQAEQIRARIAALASAPRDGSGAQAMPATQAQWQQNLPPSARRQQRLADLLEMSLRLGLTGARTEYRLSVDPASGLERMRVTMPLSGNYGVLRQFIGAALAGDPALSLDSLKIRRATPQAADVDAELVWSLHSRMEVSQ